MFMFHVYSRYQCIRMSFQSVHGPQFPLLEVRPKVSQATKDGNLLFRRKNEAKWIKSFFKFSWVLLKKFEVCARNSNGNFGRSSKLLQFAVFGIFSTFLFTYRLEDTPRGRFDTNDVNAIMVFFSRTLSLNRSRRRKARIHLCMILHENWIFFTNFWKKVKFISDLAQNCFYKFLVKSQVYLWLCSKLQHNPGNNKSLIDINSELKNQQYPRCLGWATWNSEKRKSAPVTRRLKFCHSAKGIGPEKQKAGKKGSAAGTWFCVLCFIKVE